MQQKAGKLTLVSDKGILYACFCLEITSLINFVLKVSGRQNGMESLLAMGISAV